MNTKLSKITFFVENTNDVPVFKFNALCVEGDDVEMNIEFRKDINKQVDGVIVGTEMKNPFQESDNERIESYQGLLDFLRVNRQQPITVDIECIRGNLLAVEKHFGHICIDMKSRQSYGVNFLKERIPHFRAYNKVQYALRSISLDTYTYFCFEEIPAKTKIEITLNLAPKYRPDFNQID